MPRPSQQPLHTSSRQFTRVRSAKQRNDRIRLGFELLEQRQLLSANLDPVWLDAQDTNQPSIAPITWFESIQSTQRIPLQSLANVDPSLPEGVAGPVPGAAGEWIVQLKKTSAQSISRLAAADSLLDDVNNDFSIISGLGSEGLILVRGYGGSRAAIEDSLAQNAAVDSFHLNQLIEGQSTASNDPEFVAGLLPGLSKIDATNAWDVTRGSLSTVVGVVDTGIDSTHPDLYLNIWINQGELPTKYLDAVGPKLTDIDGDGLITFYDLNNVTRAATAPYAITVGGFTNGPNASFVRDLNKNSRIDAQDLLADANWADGRDTDNNGFFDDFFGVNFRSGADDPFADNNPSDPLGHGTHVAGTIGAIGGNGTGVVGVTWQTSLMSLRILDNNNQGDSGAAIRAINYAREMRDRYRVDTAGRVTQGANVRVLNNSWGQPGGYEASLEAAIQDSSDAGILFVAAAGNGNFLGQGVDNDRTPFYPASYDVSGVIAVAASDSTDRPANFSNYGAKSVDLFAPGVGIRSTLPGGGYGSANGTSMATPHVAGTAALIWSAFPEATIAEVSKAILDNVDTITNGSLFVSTAGRLNASKAINADVFAPAARLVAKQDITTAGGTTTEFTVEYSHRSSIDTATLGDDDLMVTRQWGPADKIVATLKANSITTAAKTATATYILTAPGGTWDALDFGDYVISTLAGKVTSLVGNKTTEARDIGLFNVRINDPSVLYVSTLADSLEPGTLRSQIIAANAASPAPRTIILESGKYTIDIPAVVDPASTFGTSLVSLGIANPGGWTNATSADFDIEGNITIVGDINEATIIDAQGIDRAFKVHANSTATLSRLTIQGGVSPGTQGGGGILSIGNLNLDQAILKKNAALGIDATNPIFGGAVASWNGNVSINDSWLTENQSDFGGGLYYGGTATAAVQRSTLDNNNGGGIYSTSFSDSTVENSTLSANVGGYGAIATGISGGFLEANGTNDSPSLSGDGRFVVFSSAASNIVPGDTNGQSDVFVYDQSTKLIERVSVSDAGLEANGGSFSQSMSADGRYVTFASQASNLVPGDTNEVADIFVYDRSTKLIERVNVNDAGGQAVFPSQNPQSGSPTMSADGRFVAFRSNANNLVPGITNLATDIYVYDRTTKLIERVSVNNQGEKGDNFSASPSLSADGRIVTFKSFARNLVPGDDNNRDDIFVYDRTTKLIERVSVSDSGLQANDESASPTLSADGRYVTFLSLASNLVPGDTNGQIDVFVYDRTTHLIERVSLSDTGVQGNNYSGNRFGTPPSLSADGRYVTFSSFANNLVAGDTNNALDIFVYDRTTKLIERVSVNDAGVQGNRDSDNPSLSTDGRYVTFQSQARNLVQGKTSNTNDIFVYDRATQLIQPITYKIITSVIDVTSTTIAFTSGSIGNAAIKGDVKVNNSLFVANEVLSDIASRLATTSSYSNILSDTPQSSLVSSLQRTGNLPPVHHLLKSNPAINSADPTRNGTRDQLGTLRVLADIGAVEATTATVGGKVYVDANRNGRFDIGEQGIPDVMVKITGAENLGITSRSDSPQTPLVNESGDLDAMQLAAGIYKFDTQIMPGWSKYTPPVEMIRNQSLSGNKSSQYPSLSGDGRYVTFVSAASNLVPGDTNEFNDIFVFDRITKLIERVSVNNAGGEADFHSEDPSLSDDGRYVTFSGGATNLVPGDTNESDDIFVYDRTTKLIERVNVSDTGEQAIGYSFSPSLSVDGRYVTFLSAGDNLVPGGTNGKLGTFVYDRTTKLIELVSVNNAGEPANGGGGIPSISADGRYVTFDSSSSNLVVGDTYGPEDVFLYDRTTKLIDLISVSNAGVQGNAYSAGASISADGRFVTFVSTASNLVPEDTNGADDIFVYDRTTKLIERVSVSDAGVQGNSTSSLPALSGDGRYVVFLSDASDIVPGDTNGQRDIFVYDRSTKLIKRVSVSDAGVQGNGTSDIPSISADGRFITFQSRANNLVPGDTNGQQDIFIAPNPFADFSLTLNLQAGDVYTDLNLGLLPNPGTINGRAFEDTIANGVFDIGEPAIASAVVFLDLDGDGLRDAGEASVTTNADGTYQFLNIDSYKSYSIVVQVPIGYEQVSPTASENFAWNIFLPAGGTVTDRDFAIRRVQSTGQSSASTVIGRLYDDRNGNKLYDAGDVPIANREVYLDATNFGIRDTNEPVEVTDANGFYSFTGLSSRNVAVTVKLDDTLVSTSPLGNSFALQKYSLFNAITAFGNPQAIATGDFNADGFQDVAVALGEGNKLIIRLNDKAGGFLSDQIDIDLGTSGVGPTALVVGQFDNDDKLDVALTANYTGKITVLLNFDKVSKAFATKSYVTVGNEPLDIASGQFGGDSKLDLVIVNKADNTVQLLTNNGSGVFTAGTAIASGGNYPVSIVVGNFTGDAPLDVTVVHAVPLTAATTSGGVTVLRGNGAGSLVKEPAYYPVGALPIDSVTADFNGDGRADLAVANFNSNSISILMGQADGTFKIQSSILGTASGAFDIAVGDVDNDGDVDVIASNLKDRNISIFRNIGVDPLAGTGDVRFEPLENIGLGQFSLAQRMPLGVANFDNDTSGPSGTGTIDIVTIPQQTDTLHVLKNRLVNGTHRVALTGLNTVTGQDFIIKSAILPPSFDVIATPLPVLEDAAQQSLTITGIKKGRETGPALRFSATSSGLALVPNPSISYISGSTQATLRFTPNLNMNGATRITVKATDAGADQLFGTSDDGIFTRSFTVTVVAVNDPPTFTTASQTSATQKAGAQSIPNFVTGIGKGGGNDEVGQSLTPFVVTADTSFFTVQPAISSTGTLTFTPSPNNSGTVPVTVTLSDLGGKTNGGNDTTTRMFNIIVLPVNDAPTFTLGSNLTVASSAGAQTRANFATGFMPGGGSDEASQVIADYIVTTNAPSLFTVAPDISNTGALTFTPAIDRSGLATISVQVRDNGGQLNGGVDLSAVKTFTINITPAITNYAIAATSASKTEGQSVTIPTAFTFTITRSGLTTGLSTVDFVVTGNGTNPATAADFLGSVLPSGTVAFQAGVTSRVVTINVAGDSAPEPDEGFIVTLKSPSALGTITTATASGTILNDDAVALLAISPASISKVEGQVQTTATQFSYTVTRSGLTSGFTTVNYAVTGTGANPVTATDFWGNALPTGSLTFKAGETSKVITLNVVADTIVEADETFAITLSQASVNTTITTASATGTIQNDDLITFLAISPASISKAEGQVLTTATQFSYTVTRSGLTSGFTTANYAVTGTGANPVTATDFWGNKLPTGSLTFKAGETSKVITLNVVADTIVEADETFTITLSQPSANTTITTTSATGTIQNDDIITFLALSPTSITKTEGQVLTTATQFKFTVTRSGLTTGFTTVNYAITPGAGSTLTNTDFWGNVLPSGTLVFKAGELTKEITINVVADKVQELDETFILTLSGASANTTITTAIATGIIQNDD